ncbi:MAG: hypothetical protein E6G66_03220 [Actinobacteria bacterium]|nr:MAG: hypothetical protein E6G66_03220 [Actinomycetota bacterium]
MSARGARVARALKMPFPILAGKLTQRGRALTHRLVADRASAWRTNGITVDLLRAWRAGARSRFFVQPADRSALVAALQAHEPEAAAATVRAADTVCGHRVPLMGPEPVELAHPIDWHRDPISGLRWELRHHSTIDYLDLDRPSDVRIVWELSRCHQWVTLGQAYWLTGSERYAAEFVAQWESWMDANPPGFGVNWTCAMEAAIRAVNWLWAIALFVEAPAFNEAAQRRFLAALADHARFILQNLEIGPRPGNHYLTDGLGLLALGMVLREVRGSDRWLERGWRIVWGEVTRQITTDGVDYEHAIGYHGYVLHCLLVAASLCTRNGLMPPAAALTLVERMLEFTMAYTRPDGTFPAIGDADDGSPIDLGSREPRSHRALLAVGATLFGRSDFKAAATGFGATSLWWLGPAGLSTYAAIPDTAEPVRSRGFQHGGFFVMRGEGRHLVVSGFEDGPASHLHHDLLSFECWADGTAYVLDPGTYTYTASAEWRNRFRSTACHNTVMVDGCEQTRLLDDPNLFPVESDQSARFTLRRWEVGFRLDHFDGEHTGYTRLAEPVVHRRQVWFDKQRGIWAVRDLLTGRGTHAARGFLHLARLDVSVASTDPWMVHVGDRSQRLTLAWISDPGLSVAVTDGWLSPRYGVIERAPLVVYEKRGVVPFDIRFVLIPVRGGAVPEIEPLRRWAMELQ